MHCEWKGHKINILDTPGYPDFSGKVKGVMRAADLVVIPLKATALVGCRDRSCLVLRQGVQYPRDVCDQ